MGPQTAKYTWLLVGLALASCRMGSDSANFNPYGSCSDCTDEPPDQGDDGSAGDGQDGDGSSDEGDGETGDGAGDGAVGGSEFELTPDFSGPCQAAGGAIDVNLGHTAESAVRALHCQIVGGEPTEALLAEWSTALIEREYVRRIDVARSFCQTANRVCSFVYSDPWQKQVSLEATCSRRGTRALGAVLMYFSECPSGVNCEMDWANSHALGMKTPHAIYGFGSMSSGYYHPDNPGFWRRELLDARWAGLSFLLLNTYGPDLALLTRTVEALDDIDGGIGLALMDDTWTWGRSDVSPWNSVPNLADTESAATVIYQSKWKPFFQTLPRRHWYEHAGRPLVYFYNAGTLEPRTSAAPVIRRMKEMFEADFGVAPFVAVDTAFFEDEAAMNAVADSRFTWDTFRFGESTSSMGGVTLEHAMVRWDALGRDHPGQIASAADRLHKGPAILESFLASSSDADLAVLATWNDLGEGTGIHRNYDYFFGGSWLPPHHFLSLIRASQCDGPSSRSSSP